MAIYGYCKISTSSQRIERQIRNILHQYPDAILFEKVYTGTKVEGRKQWQKIMCRVVAGDTIVFVSVSRMNRDAAHRWLQEWFRNHNTDSITTEVSLWKHSRIVSTQVADRNDHKTSYTPGP